MKDDLDITLREFKNPCDVSNINDLYNPPFTPVPYSNDRLIPHEIEIENDPVN